MMQPYWTAANVITVSRLGIFALSLFYIAQDRLIPAVAAFAVAWGLDAFDGFVARRFGQASEFGSMLDKVVDRFIIVVGILAFISAEYLPAAALLLGTKDIALLPSLTIHAARGENTRGLGWEGKALSVLQGGAVVWLLVDWPYQNAVIGLVAVLGAMAAYRYLRAIV